jgi:hypothetical protein
MTLAASTIKQYETVLKSLRLRGVNSMNYSDELYELIGTKKDDTTPASLNSIKSIISAIIYENKSRKVDYSIWKEKQLDLMKKIEGAKTYRADDSTIPWKDLKDLYKSDISYSDKLLLAVYTLIPPRRVLDYSEMLVVARLPRIQAAGKNYLTLGKRMNLHFFAYKTAKNYGHQTFPVPAELRRLILAAGATVGNPLFPTLAGGFYSQAEFSTKLGNITEKLLGKGRRATANTFRHAYITHFLSSNPTTPQRKKIAAAMAQSVEMSIEYDQRE